MHRPHRFNFVQLKKNSIAPKTKNIYSQGKKMKKKKLLPKLSKKVAIQIGQL
jgi:hypothetical protein